MRAPSWLLLSAGGVLVAVGALAGGLSLTGVEPAGQFVGCGAAVFGRPSPLPDAACADAYSPLVAVAWVLLATGVALVVTGLAGVRRSRSRPAHPGEGPLVVCDGARWSTRRWSGVLLVVVVLVAVGATAAQATLPPHRTAQVARPARDASPRQVVRTYLAALDAHDCATAESLVEPELTDDARSWCEDVAGLDAPRVRAAHREIALWSGRRAPDQVVDVGVSFGLRWRAFHGDSSLPEGRTVWGYLLVRHSPSDPWRISDQGVG